MRPLKLIVLSVSVLLSSAARAQDAAPAPVPAPPPSEPTAAPPAPTGQVFDGEQPKAPKPAPAPRHRPPVVDEPPASTMGVGLEVATSGFASGDLQGGLLFGIHSAAGTLVGVRMNYLDQTSKLGSESVSTTALAIGLAARLPVAGSRDGFDLTLGADVSYVNAKKGALGGEAATGGSGFQLGFGPQIRYWIHHNVALGYLVQATYSSVTSDQKDSSGQSLEQTEAKIGGAFTITAGF
jgi:hypothetical protein